VDKAKGKAKEAAGAMSGDEDLKAEGRAQQRKAEAEEKAAQKQRARRAEEEAKQAEREKRKQERKDKGVLGGISDSLS
jgi:uncharacterized protein YjbJ (UPF0337 family)